MLLTAKMVGGWEDSGQWVYITFEISVCVKDRSNIIVPLYGQPRGEST